MSLNFGGINIGGTSGGGGTTNHAQLTNLDYASSGHTGFLSSENYIPAGTIITVGTGKNFETLKQAHDSLEGKWSNGTVTIQIDNGEYSGSVSLSKINNIPSVIIAGTDVNSTVLKYTPGASGWGQVLAIGARQRITLRNITLESDNSSGYSGLLIDGAESVTLDNLKCKNTAQYGISIAGISNVTLRPNGITLTNSTVQGQYGIYVELGATVYGYYNSKIEINNFATGISASMGARVTLNQPLTTFTSVTTQYNPTVNSINTGTGWIFKNN